MDRWTERRVRNRYTDENGEVEERVEWLGGGGVSRGGGGGAPPPPMPGVYRFEPRTG